MLLRRLCASEWVEPPTAELETLDKAAKEHAEGLLRPSPKKMKGNKGQGEEDEDEEEDEDIDEGKREEQ